MGYIIELNTVDPQGAYSILDLPEGAYYRGGLFTKLSDKDIFGSFFSSLSHILPNQHTIFRLKYINLTVFIPNHTIINMQGCLPK